MTTVPEEVVHNCSETEEREQSDLDLSAEPELVTSCFSNPLILQKILSNLPTGSLLSSSLVSKLWSYECRKLLRDTRKVMAHIGPSSPCQDLRNFCEDIQAMKIVPFNGLRINIDLTTHTSIMPSSCLGLNGCTELPDNFQLKYLQVNWKTFRRKIEICPVVQLISELMCSNQLTELYLRVPEDSPTFAIPSVAAGQANLCHLKVLKLPRQGICQSHLNGIKELLRTAPNLQEFHHDGSPPFVQALLDLKRVELLKIFDFSSTREVLNGRVASVGPKLCELRVQAEDFREFDTEKCGRSLGAILHASQESLKHLRIDAVFLGLLVKWNISMKCVTKLEILIECPAIDVGRPIIYAVLKYLNFTVLFPKLTHIDFREGSVGLSGSLLNKLIKRNLTSRSHSDQLASNIKHVSFHGGLRSHAAQNFSTIFPNLSSLYASFTSGNDVPFTSIWSGWPKLEEIVLAVKETSSMGWNSWRRRTLNLDSVFCGIFPEEVTELREQSEEFLRKVHIVAVRPSVNNLQGLRKLGISFRSGSESSNSYPKVFCLSKVGALVGLKRLPRLRTILTTDGGMNLTTDLISNGFASVIYSSSHDLVLEF